MITTVADNPAHRASPADTKHRRSGVLRALGRKAPEFDRQRGKNLQVLRTLGRKIDASDPAAVREAAKMVVSQLFFVPLLAEIRKQPFGGQIGHGGRGEEVFGEQLDQILADKIAAGDRGGLTDQIESRLAKRDERTGAAGLRGVWRAALQSRGIQPTGDGARGSRNTSKDANDGQTGAPERSADPIRHETKERAAP